MLDGTNGLAGRRGRGGGVSADDRAAPGVCGDRVALYRGSVDLLDALVFYPARSGRPGLAALVYAVAGWGGSGLGIGLAEGREELPAALIIVAGMVILFGLLWRNTLRSRET